MCKKKQFRYCPSQIDECMKKLVHNLDCFLNDFKVVACCCGHGKYPMTILVRSGTTGMVYDICSNKIIPRKRNFYKKDRHGYYFIPESLNVQKESS